MQLFSYLFLSFALGIRVAAAPFKDDYTVRLNPHGLPHELSNNDETHLVERPLTPYWERPPTPPAPPSSPAPVDQNDGPSHLARRGYPPFDEPSHRTEVNLADWSRMYLPEGWVCIFFSYLLSGILHMHFFSVELYRRRQTLQSPKFVRISHA